MKREEFIEALAVAVYMGGGPSLMYAAEAMHAYDEFARLASAPLPINLERLLRTERDRVEVNTIVGMAY